MEQSRFIWLEDDAGLGSATHKAAESVGDVTSRLAMVNADLDANYRCRLRVRETAGGNPGGHSFQLEYRLNGGTWTTVNATSSVVRSSASPNVTDGAATADNELTGGAGTGVFDVGWFDEVDGLSASINMSANDWTDVEYCFQFRSADISDSDTVDLRVTDSGSALDTYTDAETPGTSWTITAAAGSLVVPRHRQVAVHAPPEAVVVW